jgi:hypothetical protein
VPACRVREYSKLKLALITLMPEVDTDHRGNHFGDIDFLDRTHAQRAGHVDCARLKFVDPKWPGAIDGTAKPRVRYNT